MHAPESGLRRSQPCPSPDLRLAASWLKQEISRLNTCPVVPLDPPPQSTGLPLCWLVAPQGTGVCHPATGLWEPLSGAGHTADLWRWFHARVGLWVGGSLETCAGDFGLGWDELPEEARG